MLLPEFEHHRPESLEEALALIEQLDSRGRDFQLYAGGTDVIPTLKRAAYAARCLVSIGHLPELCGIEVRDGRLRIGAATTLSAVASSDVVAEHAPWLAATVLQIASPQIRNRGTIGGNLLVDNRCHIFDQSPEHRATHRGCFKAGGDACQLVLAATRESTPVCRARFVSDAAAVLTVAEANLVFVGGPSERTVPIRDLYSTDGVVRDKANHGELLVRIEVQPHEQLSIGYEKLRIRNALDFPSVGVALAREGAKVRVCLTGVDTHPVLLEVAADAFETDAEMLSALSTWARGSITPLAQDVLPPAYRRKMAGVLIHRLWREARD